MCFRPAEISMNNCSACGAKNKPIAKKCEICGEPLVKGPASIICPLCGASNPPSASVCSSCGATEDEILTATGAKPPTVPKAAVPAAAPKAPPQAPKPPIPPRP